MIEPQTLSDTSALARFEAWLIREKRMSWREYRRRAPAKRRALVEEFVRGDVAADKIAESLIRRAYARYTGEELPEDPPGLIRLPEDEPAAPSVPYSVLVDDTAEQARWLAIVCWLVPLAIGAVGGVLFGGLLCWWAGR